MGNARDPSARSRNVSCDTVNEKQKKEAKRGARLRTRAGFSDGLSTLDLDSLAAELEVAEEDSLKDAHPSGEAVEHSPKGLDSEPASSKASTSSDSENQENPSKASTSADSENQHNESNPVRWTGFMKILKKGSVMRFHAPLKGVTKLTRRKSKRGRDNMLPSLDADMCYLKPSWINFPLSELQKATNNFSHENLIGQGGYAEVYKGQLQDGRLVAIKRLMKGEPEEMTTDYLSELGIIVHVDHPNIAKLIGYGVEGGMHLVLQLSPHGSLASLLYGSKEKLNWGIRFKVAVGTAEGLSYLHEGCQRRIIHKDIKAANILLTEDFEAQISDFGLAKWLPDQWTHHTVSKVEGTFGYLPPEFFLHGIVDEKTDVYAYGVLLLELITGRQALDSSQKSLVMWAKPLIDKDNIKALVDPALGSAYDQQQLSRVITTASMCIHQSAMHRPHMREALEILKGDPHSLEQLKLRQKSLLARTYSAELYDAEDYNSTKYLNEMNHQMELLLGSNESDSDS